MAQFKLSFCHRFKNKILVGIFTVLVLIVFSYYTQVHVVTTDYLRGNITTYRYRDTSTFVNYEITQKLEDSTTESEVQRPKVFFIETTFKSDIGEFKLDARQACSVESAARMNPHMDILVQFASKTKFDNDTSHPIQLLQILLDNYSNIQLNYVNIYKFSEGTPAETFFKRRRFEMSLYPIPHLSDVLRVLTLWKYGGTYLDLDIVVQKPLDSVPENYAGLEESNSMGSSILNVDTNGLGHKMMEECLDTLMRSFDGFKWAENGPVVVSNAVRKLCNTTDLGLLKTDNCSGFTLLPIESCYSIHWTEYMKFYKPGHVEEVMRRVNDSLVVHLWNHYKDINRRIPVDSNVPYIHLAKQFCPTVIQNCGEYF